MVLPKSLMRLYREKLSFYSCTVPNFEQYTLAKFIERGFFEKHINRMRNYYRTQRDTVMSCIKAHPHFSTVTIREENSGLHFLMSVRTKLSDEQLKARAREKGINISCLSDYFTEKTSDSHTVVINYSGLPTEKISEAVSRLFACFDD